MKFVAPGRLSYRFCLRPSQSPTYYNLCHYLIEQGWASTRFNYLAHFSEKNFDFNLPAAECLEFKHLLAQLVKQYCPQVMPITYCINDHNWPIVLNQIADYHYKNDHQLLDEQNDLAWILKPALLNNGQHIKIFQNLSQLEQHYLNNDRLGGEHVLQQYLLNPHLLRGPQLGHKYSIRMFLVLTNNAGAFLYPQGYFNVGLHPYQNKEFTDLRSHLTNEHLKEDELNVVQVPTQQYELFKLFYPQIKAIISAVVQALQQAHPLAFIKERTTKLAIFGFDFMVDDSQRVWLLEANHAPCFPINADHPLQKSLYYDFWQSIITNFVLPIANKMPIHATQMHPFEEINTESLRLKPGLC